MGPRAVSRHTCPACGRSISRAAGGVYVTHERLYVYLRRHKDSGGEWCQGASVRVATRLRARDVRR